MSEAELKLTAVLVRLTYGYHRKEVKLTYDGMGEKAKLSRGGVSNAINAINERGFFTRGNKSMWYANSLPSRLNDEDETVHQVDQNSTPSRLKSIDESLPSRLPHLYKEKENKERENIYIPTDSDPIAKMKTAVSTISKETLWVKTESLFTEAAYELIGRDAEPEQVMAFGEWWKSNGWHGGKPALQNVLDHWQDFKAGRCLRRGENGNGRSPSRPIPEPEETRRGGLY